MKSVYLSGPISGLTYEGATDWRGYAIRHLLPHNIAGLSPMRGKQYLGGLGVIEDRMPDVTAHAMSQDSAIVARDRYDATKCDFMLVNLVGADRVSIGTMVEYGWADLARVPVVLVMEPQGNVHEHAFVRQLSSYRVGTLDAALGLIIAALAVAP